MAAPSAAGGPLTCVLRAALVWILPVLCTLAGLSYANEILWGTSALAASLEVLLCACSQSKDLRRLSNSARQAPYPMRLVVLLALQLWCMVIASATGHGGAPPADFQGATHKVEGTLGGGAAQELVEAPVAAPAPGGAQPGTGVPFIVDADPATLRWKPKTISVVLPCAEEREYALKTVESLWKTTPDEVLQEIIVVDDGSEPPLSKTVLPPDVQKKYKVKIMRHEQTVGLIGAKKTGGDAMVGDIGVFFDCHVAAQPGWHHDFLQLISENYRRMVVPQITALDIDTWTQVGSGGGMAKCYLTWDADFKWFDSDDMYIAVISGGLLGMSRRWWQETGGYDKQMLGWGGENLDQSLRMWLCGGEIVAASNSYVAHMWRTGDHRTSARYKHVGDASVNRARAVYAWYGEFATKLQHYPNFANRPGRGGLPWYGNLSNILEFRDRLKCRPFSWFLRRFKSLYEDAGIIPETIFMLKEEKTGLCLKFDGFAGTSGSGFGSASMMRCDDESDHRLFWHLGNKNRRGGHCCSGMRAWNTDQCITHVEGTRVKTGVCDVSGRNVGQTWAVTENSHELRHRDECIGVDSSYSLMSKPCIAMRAVGSKWVKVKVRVPLETELYHKARTEHPEVFARLDRELAGAAKSGLPPACSKHGGCFTLHRKSEGGRPGECLDENLGFSSNMAECQLFYLEGKEVKTASEGTCLDRMNDASFETWGAFGCHGGNNQKYERTGNTICDDDKSCLVMKQP